ncbi:uroporphyrinogen-III synthase [Micrococcus sp. FDAARGOS_333]|uniref:uroporphyrinogen-III synthase n=1 Tax=Micrococcus sp. FDAARGOS_333 TaxID=1930558 RepID=UPI001438851C|nr:uroporphyrinogen-III synthase [Micrococcus sp. FDAARGOS_333]
MRHRPLVLTRQPSQAGAVEADLAAAGLDVRFCPLTDFELSGEPGPLRAVVARVEAGECAWLVLTSPNTVRALQAAGWTGRVGGSTKVAVTGAGTARVLAELGCTAEPWMPEQASAAGILADFPSVEPAGRCAADAAMTADGADVAGDAGDRSVPQGADADVAGDRSVPQGADADVAVPQGAVPQGVDADVSDPHEAPASLVLLPQSALATGELTSGLEAKGWHVARVEAYRTVPYPADPSRRLLPEPQGGADHAGELDRSGDTAGPAPGAGSARTARPGHGAARASHGVARASHDAARPGHGAARTGHDAPVGEMAEAGAVVVPVARLAGHDVVLTSPSAARELATHHGLDDERVRLTSRLVAIGRPTAAEARRLGLELSAVAQSPDAEGILRALGHGLSLQEAGGTAEVDGEYAEPGPLRDALVAAILAGEKTATSALLRDYEAAQEPLPRAGTRERVLDSAGQVAAVVEVTGVTVVPLGRVPHWHVVAEGEGHRDVRAWRAAHEEFWGGALPDETEVVLIQLTRIA